MEDGRAILVSTEYAYTEYAVGNRFMIVYVAVELTAEPVGDRSSATAYNDVP